MKTSIRNMIGYFVSVAILYAVGYAFQNEYLMLQKETYFASGAIKEASGSMLPFFLALPILLYPRLKMKLGGKQS